jgi:uncharacterized protein
MQKHNGQTLFSASDVVAFLECAHVTTLGLVDLVTPLPRAEDDESAVLIQEKGYAHESEFLATLKAKGLRMAEMRDDGDPETLARATRQAMEEGHDVVFQATFLSGALYGRADFLRRVESPSRLGAHSYEVLDTKLARSAKAKFVIQLAFYSDLLADVQGIEPRMMHLALGDGTERSYRVANYSHYLRRARARFLAFAARHPNGTYPERCDYCEFCAWRDVCEARWKADDHLNQVAGITRKQIERLQAAGTRTIEALASLPTLPRIAKLQPETAVKLRSQAALQLARRRTGEPSVELLDIDPEHRRGFCRLPAPDAGDVFFDMEGDPFEGLEYLFGLRFVDAGETRFETFWAHDRAGERAAFEALMDFFSTRIRRFPRMHIHHYSAYEPSALKRLMSLHGTREAQMDDLLRGQRFVDLYKVVREAMRTSEPGLSIKDLEVFYMPPREGDVRTAGASIVHYERWRDTHEPAELEKIRRYNEDDCRSTHLLRDWLIGQRPAGLPWFAGELPGDDEKIERPVSARILEIEEGLARHREALLDGLPDDRAQWGADEHVRELACDLLDFHRREAKPAWWAMYARQDMTDDELIEDVECLGGLARSADPPVPVKQSLVYRFTFPEQETKLRVGDRCYRTDTRALLGEIVALDETSGTIEIKVGRQREVPQTLSIGPEGPINTEALRDAVWRVADSLARRDGRFAAVRSLLRRDAPAFQDRARVSDPAVAGPQETFNGTPALTRVAALADSYLFIQGPPGAGKTTVGSQLIIGLLRQGKRVGVTSNSHKVINQLLEAVEKRAAEQGFTFSGVKKSNRQDPETLFEGRLIADRYTNDDVLAAGAQLVAGTAWLFADPQLEASLDYLFVDEAGQVSLANLVAIGTAARNIVLLGDQMQLGQPIQGVHPGRSGESTLEYLLDGQATVAADRGIFLGTTWRMHDDVCRFISEAVYDGRLEPEPGNRNQRLVLNGSAHEALLPAGIRFLAVRHTGCSQRSEAEAAIVKEVFDSLLAQDHVDKEGTRRHMAMDNILVVAPYNAQVNLLKSTLPAGARVGTIDKFQGREAEAVIVSMTTSSAADLPRNIEFLYDKNRLNVAVSRAKCLAIVVASPELLHAGCRSPEQIELVNTLCWLREYAEGSRTP